MKLLKLLAAFLIIPSLVFAQSFGNLYADKALQIKTRTNTFGKFLPASATTVQSALDYINQNAGTGSGSGSQWITTANVGIGTYDNVGIGTITPTSVLTTYGALTDTGVDVNSNAPSDFDSYQVLLLHMDDASLIDSNTNPKTMTLGGNFARSATQSKFGGFSAADDGVGDYEYAADSTDFFFDTNAFTIDFWANITTSDAYGYGQGSGDFLRQYMDTNNVCFYAKTSGSFVLNTCPASARSLGTWYHYALIKGWGGDTTKCAITVNGTALAGAPISCGAFPNATGNFYIGTDETGTGTSGAFYIDEFRVSKGIARWTSNFTPPTAAYSNVGVNAPRLKFQSAGTAKFTMGVDGADNNQFKIGTTAIATNTRLAIDSSGNVGIGSVSPGQVLDVQGIIRNSSTHQTGAGTVSLPAHTFSTDTDTGMYSGGANDLRLGTGGVNSVTITPNGNVGIGTVTASSKLSLGNDFANTKLSVFDNVAALIGFGVQSGEFRFHVNANTTDFKFYDAPAGNALMTIKGTGNVGIGTTVPSGGLTVMNGNVGIGTWKPASALEIIGTGNVGIGTTVTPTSPLNIGGNLLMDRTTSAIIMKESDGTCGSCVLSSTEVFTCSSITCP